MSETNVYQAYSGNTYLFGGNAPYVEEMYENYLANPGSVPDTWRDYFDALQHVPAVDGSNAKDVPHQPVINAFALPGDFDAQFLRCVVNKLTHAILHTRCNHKVFSHFLLEHQPLHFDIITGMTPVTLGI